MNWEQKTEMCKLLNGSHYEQALDLVVKNIETMDEQAWDMFYNGIELINELILPLIDNHKIIREKNAEMEFGSARTAMRAALHEMIVDEIINKPTQS